MCITSSQAEVEEKTGATRLIVKNQKKQEPREENLRRNPAFRVFKRAHTYLKSVSPLVLRVFHPW